MTGLAEFLLARIAEDEAVAQVTIEAKRAIVEKCRQYGDPLDADYGDGAPCLAEEILALLGQGFADRPGYRSEWAPAE